MSIASEITSIGENLKKDYQAIANLGADLTNVDKNIENIAELLDGVYDNLPKTEYGEGTEVNLGKTIKGKLEFDNGVVGIGQSSQDSTNGYQLIPFPYNEMNVEKAGVKWSTNSDGTINAKGTADATSSIFYLTNGDDDLYLDVDTYKISTNLFTLANGFDVQVIKIVNGSYSTVYTSDMVLTERTRLRVRVIARANAVVNVQNAYMMINSGSTAQPYEKYTGGQASPNPSYPQTINSVTGNQDVVVSGINKLSYAEAQTEMVGTLECKSNGDGTYTMNGTSSISGGYDFQISSGYTIKEGDYFFINNNKTNSNVAIALKTSSEDQITAPACNVVNKSFDLTQYAGKTINYIRLYANSGQTLDNLVVKPFIYNSSTQVPFEPYTIPKSYQLSLGDKKLYDECTIVGSPDNWKFVDNYYKEKFSGHISGRQGTNTTGKVRFVMSTTYNAPPTLDSVVADIYSNILKKKTANQNYLRTDSIVINSTGQILFYYEDWAEYSLTEMQDYFANRDDYIVYPLVTPIETPITDTTLISQLNAWYNAHSNNGTTIITSNGNLPMIIKVRGLKGE